ncbi:MAG: 30S ribosomal protein S15 [Minisyncoccia bacterium]|jgi:small subunit ribosomal protein S15
MANSKVQEIIKKFGKHEKDTGSCEVQIALLTEEIINLTKHLQKHPKDYNSKRGLILKIAQRRKLLKYLERKSATRYKKLKELLNL